jgi:hypothetical protein
MLNGSFIAFPDDFGVADGAGAFFMVIAGEGDGADFVGVCAIAAEVINTDAVAAKHIADTVK